MENFFTSIDLYIREYNVEASLYKEGAKFLKRGWLEREEFLKICLWKSRRSKQKLKKNTSKQIEDLTRLAFAEKDERKKMEYLIKLKGVGVPMASAILSVTNQNKYPVIDIRTVQALNRLRLFNHTHISINCWLEYLSVMDKLKKRVNRTARELDKALFAFHRMRLDKGFKNLYKTY